jgi:S-adenosylmethionine:tRNA ribosyltransferase-isomerase
MIRLEDLDYALPPDRIAQHPARPRDTSRLLILDRTTGALEAGCFRDLADRIPAVDLLVVNDTRVVPARLRGRKATGGQAEALLLERLADGAWTALVRTRGRLRDGLRIRFGEIEAEVEATLEDGRCRLRLHGPDGEALLTRLGEAPLPPYIRRPHPLKQDLEDYQSIFARVPGAVAAPTASLHFTDEMAARLRLATLTLHVGPGTFRPLRSDPIDAYRLDPETFFVPPETAAAIESTRASGGRVTAVGTTVVRALETTAGRAGSGKTDLLILPGYRFRAVDSLLTNFHLPRSSLLALVMAFAGVESVRRAYAYAVEHGFRFYSYGDAMWIR